jgi:hypothetical protein
VTKILALAWLNVSQTLNDINMPFLVRDDLTTHLNDEIIDEITRADDTKADKAIAAAVGEAKSYLSRFDLLKIFGDSTTDPVVPEEQLATAKDFIKQIACWKLIKISNPNVNMELFKTGYEEAIAWFKRIQSGGADPEGWPYKVDDSATKTYDENSTIQFTSNIKRSNHW